MSQAVLSALKDAISKAKAENAEIVAGLALREVDAEIVEHHGLWSVPIASGVAGGTGHSLMDGLRKLGQAIEKHFNQPVSVYYHPSIIPPARIQP